MEVTEEEVFAYLVQLRDSGVTNMFGASPYVGEHFDLPRQEAQAWLMRWIKSFAG